MLFTLPKQLKIVEIFDLKIARNLRKHFKKIKKASHQVTFEEVQSRSELENYFME